MLGMQTAKPHVRLSPDLQGLFAGPPSLHCPHVAKQPRHINRLDQIPAIRGWVFKLRY
jgi:hypothetical protein